MQPMCDDTMVFMGWAVGVADCDGVTTFEYFDEDFVSQGTSLPTDWRPCVQGEQGDTWVPSQSTVTFASPTDIDFGDGDQFKTLSINGNLTLTGSGYQVATEIWLRIVETGGNIRTLTFPSGWVRVGGALPSTLAANKTLLIHLISYGTTEANVVVHNWVQS